MSKKDNFNRAVFDMFGVGSDSVEPEEPRAEAAQEVAPEESLENIHIGEQDTVRHAAPYVLVPSTYLAAGTIVEGTLKSKGDVEIAGSFSGEIEAEGDVTVRNRLVGNITAANLSVVDCNLEGDCHVTGKVQIGERSHVTGNMFVGEMACAGVVEGDIVAQNAVMLTPSAKLTGNITTAALTVERGASIDGKLSMSK